MLPRAYGLPAALLLMLGGAVSCFAGYRLFRTVLGIYGFILGAMLASSMMGTSNTIGMVVAALVGGLVGALVLVMAYLVGIALVGAGLAALIGHVIWTRVATGDPPVVAVIIVSIVGALGAMVLQRYVIIVGTAFGGAWTMVVGAVNAMAARGVIRGASETDVWIFYPTSVPDERWAALAWIALAIVGIAVQLGVTGKNKRRK